MPYKKTIEQYLPHVSPRYVPEHPMNHIPSFETEEDTYWGIPEPQNEKRRKRLQKEWLEKAMENWVPPHVVRSWEVDEQTAIRYHGISNLELHPRPRFDYELLNTTSKYDSSVSKRLSSDLYSSNQDPNKTNFRRFASRELKLAYHRFHASHGDPNVPSEEEDPTLPPEDICWIMEYSDNECAVTRRKIAKLMGLYPATTDFETDHYDPDIAEEYSRRLYVRCRRRNKKCVRPSHLVIFGSDFKDLP